MGIKLNCLSVYCVTYCCVTIALREFCSYDILGNRKKYGENFVVLKTFPIFAQNIRNIMAKRYLDPKADLTFKRVFGEHPDLV